MSSASFKRSGPAEAFPFRFPLVGCSPLRHRPCDWTTKPPARFHKNGLIRSDSVGFTLIGLPHRNASSQTRHDTRTPFRRDRQPPKSNPNHLDLPGFTRIGWLRHTVFGPFRPLIRISQPELRPPFVFAPLRDPFICILSGDEFQPNWFDLLGFTWICALRPIANDSSRRRRNNAGTGERPHQSAICNPQSAIELPPPERYTEFLGAAPARRFAVLTLPIQKDYGSSDHGSRRSAPLRQGAQAIQ